MAGKDEKKKKPVDKKDEPPKPPPPAPKKPKPPLTDVDRRAQLQVGELRLRLDDIESKLEGGALTELTESDVGETRARLEHNRATLEDTLARLPPGDPLLAEGVPLLRRASAAIVRLDQIRRAAHGHAQQRSRERETAEDVFGRAEARAPRGYCDGAGAADATHCALGEERVRYRAKIGNLVQMTHTNWTAAITTKSLEEKFRKQELSFEQKLGQLLLDLLFAGFGAAAKYVASQGIKMAAKAMTDEVDVAPGITESIGPSPATVEAAQDGVKGVIKKGVSAAEKAVGGHKTARQVHEEARVSAPADREAFLQVMKAAPTRWATSILGNLDQLYDEDLAALFVALPESPPLPTEFEQHIEDLLRRFGEQVLAVNHAVRPIQVVTADRRVRTALVTQAVERNNDLKGEWLGSPTATGRTRFVRWVDEDMIEMAQAHHRAENAYVLPEVQRFDDGSFWSDESLKDLAKPDRQPVPSSPLVVRHD